VNGDAAPARPRDPALERLNTLSDGVFAIAMTLVAFDVRPPAHWDHTLPGLLDALAGPFQAFFWSFFAAAIFWTTHRRLFMSCTRSTAMLTGLNLLLLGEITLIPVATRMLTDLSYIGGALSIYLGLYLVIGVTNAVLWIYATRIAGIAHPRPGPGAVVVVALTLAVMPALMTALGVLMVFPQYGWLPLLMPIVFGASLALRRLAAWYDRRVAAVDNTEPK
jgi:uncharacterized membrane protein